ncbi:MAG: hypothetical protein J0I06_12945 [Planctomycetes bacterium]|nr:hypothetical protein [Planctomycetota bacterium]
MRYGPLWAAVAAAVAFAGGCGGPKAYPVRGKITFEGKPMKGGGAISFVPAGGRSGRAAGGAIKDDGTYELTTDKPGDGAATGEFRVVILQSTDREPDATKDGERAGKAVAVVAEPDRIPAVYADPMKSPLTAKVEARENALDFDLKRDAGGPPVRGAMRGRDPLRDGLRDTFAGLGWPATRSN